MIDPEDPLLRTVSDVLRTQCALPADHCDQMAREVLVGLGLRFLAATGIDWWQYVRSDFDVPAQATGT